MREINEIEISMVDMFWTIIGKWRWILILMISCAVVTGAYSYTKSYSAYQDTLTAQNEEQKISKEDFIEGMEEEEIEKVEYTAIAVARYRQLYAQQEEYINNSILMLENPLAVPTVTLQYFIDNHYKVEYPMILIADNIGTIIQAYVSGIADGELNQTIADELKKELDASYYEEVISVGKLESGFNVQITHYNKETCQKIAEVVKQYIENMYDDMVATNGEFDLVLVSDNYQEKISTSLITTQQENTNKLANIKKAEIALKDELSEKEKDYYEYLLNETEKNEAEKLGIEDEDLSQPEIVAPSVNLKYIFVGAFLGIVLAFVFLGVLYIMDKRLHRTNDFPIVFGVDILGTVEVDRQKKKRLLGWIDQCIRKLRYRGKRNFSKDEALKMIAVSIKILLQNTESKKILITGCAWSEEVKNIANKIQQELQKNGMTVYCVENMIYNAEDMMYLQNVDSVVLLETLRSTTFEEVKKEVRACRKGKVPVAGAVVVEMI